jgi:hypothetical protein
MMFLFERCFIITGYRDSDNCRKFFWSQMRLCLKQFCRLSCFLFFVSPLRAGN